MKPKEAGKKSENQTRFEPEVSSKEKKSKKAESTGSRWAALILLIATIIFSLIALLQGQLFNDQDKTNTGSNSADWQFSVE